ncbi:hypothetical protein A1O7_07661 [Cladophialophora yegresii CBS 114405]|uniref:Zn(2)-C6 fungal-type domain-containing protein n=1 Tax=Cladophialophora yegresii CBS 114405 TaxID=1182544 RepID=W9WFK8_9EURO|nr:uncharacterized protein A1O7_07661 [Cladophialophora yegresii CBS 114405]EXJ57314.1 hypothetical protein A1O7_07661 [Cladophialophora yegresii CBS 114405]
MSAEVDLGSSAVQALRESFGDRKPIDISRKITACVACRKQKIKCHMGDGVPPCTRCRKRGLSCVVNRSLQMLLESDVAWKANIEEKLRQLEDSVNLLNQRSGSGSNAPPDALPQPSAPQLPSQPDATMTTATTTEQPQQREQGWEVVMDMDRGPAVIPASCVSEVSDASPTATRQTLVDDFDLIDRGIISLDDAESFFRLYARRLDHFLYTILAEHDSLASVRKSSPLLTAAICAVGALHTPSNLYYACYQHFVSLASSRMFSKRNNHDDVRAFCIGAFWLSDISWTLVGAGK